MSRKRLGRRGQTTVEYALILATTVAEALVFWNLMCKAMPPIFGRVECMVNSENACKWP